MEEFLLHSFEAGRRGKPDEFETQLSNLVAAEVINVNSQARFDIRVTGGFSKAKQEFFANINGEISDFVVENPEFKGKVRRKIAEYFNYIYREELPLDAISIDFNAQSTELATNSGKAKAGDSGTVIAVAYKYGPFHLPFERFLAVAIRDVLDAIYLEKPELSLISGQLFARYEDEDAFKQSVEQLRKGIKADGKIEATANYVAAEYKRIRSITIACEHNPEILPVAELREHLNVVNSHLFELLREEYNFEVGEPRIFINTADDWPVGGWRTDAGTREAKPYRDAFSSYGVCSDSFGGEDPSKPEGTGTLMAREAAVKIIKANLAEFAKVTLVFQIGRSEPIVNVFTNGTGKKSQKEIEEFVRDSVNTSIADVADQFKMHTGDHYFALVDASDYFQDPQFPWNQ
jgi:S-adenosylmethionine synthetase